MPNDYDRAVDALLDDLKKQVRRERPEDVVEFLRKRLLLGQYVLPSSAVCEGIQRRYPLALAERALSVVVLGASGDLAKKKTFPALFALYCRGLLPSSVPRGEGGAGAAFEGDVEGKSDGAALSKVIGLIVGYARTPYTQVDFHAHLRPYLERSAPPEHVCHIANFLKRHVRYVSGDNYASPSGYAKLRAVLEHHEQRRVVPSDEEAFIAITGSSQSHPNQPQAGNRLFYLALPPTAFIETCAAIRAHLCVDGEFGGAGAGGSGSPRPYSPSTSAMQALLPEPGSPVSGGSNANTTPFNSGSGGGGGWTRVIVEKPFGHDTRSSNVLADALNALFSEAQLFRIDHYLGKEMVQNVVSLRFANHVLNAVWNNHHIHNIQITFKEKIGTEGRGGYFDKFGIIRDVIQNHLCQILALVAMEKPRSLSAEDVRDEKVAVLRCIEPVDAADCVLGQYTASPDGKIPGYLEDPGVPAGSRCPTFAAVRLRICNDRWAGVPVIIKAGKALEERVVTVRVQFRDELRPFSVTDTGRGPVGSDPDDESAGAFLVPPNRNELVIRAQPDEAMYLKINTKNPGLMADPSGGCTMPDRPLAPITAGEGASQTTASASASASAGITAQRPDLCLTELDLSYGTRFAGVTLPDAYESLINEAILGNSTNFVRRDELEAAWRIFTPILHKIDRGEVPVHPYVAGSRGPSAAQAMVEASGYRRSVDYFYAPHK